MGTFLDSLSKSTVEASLHASEVLLLVSGAVLLVGIWGEYRKGEKWKKYLSAFQVMVLAGIGFELVADAGVFLFSESLQRLEGSDILALDKKARSASDKATEALGMSSTAEDKSEAANNTSRGALSKSGKAESAASAALGLAKGARQEADSFEKDIAAAKLQLLDLTPRNVLLRNGEPEVLAAIEPFKGTKVELWPCGTFGDETFFLYGALVEVLNKAKWDVNGKACNSKGSGIMVTVNPASSIGTIDAANALGRILSKVLRTLDSETFNRLDKLFSEQKAGPWRWATPNFEPTPPLEREVVRVQILSRPPR